VSASASGGVENAQIAGAGPENGDVLSHPRTLGVQFNQHVWNGNRTYNSIRQAESQVFGQREVLRNTEQTVLLSALSGLHDLWQFGALGERRQRCAGARGQKKQAREPSLHHKYPEIPVSRPARTVVRHTILARRMRARRHGRNEPSPWVDVTSAPEYDAAEASHRNQGIDPADDQHRQ
jgi:hypothetical protein